MQAVRDQLGARHGQVVHGEREVVFVRRAVVRRGAALVDEDPRASGREDRSSGPLGDWRSSRSSA